MLHATTVLDADDAAVGLQFGDPIDQQKRVAMGKDPPMALQSSGKVSTSM